MESSENVTSLQPESFHTFFRLVSPKEVDQLKIFVGDEAVEFLKGTHHPIYTYRKTVLLPAYRGYLVRDHERLLVIEREDILTSKVFNPSGKGEEDAPHISFAFEKDLVEYFQYRKQHNIYSIVKEFPTTKQGEFFNKWEVSNQRLNPGSMTFLRFAGELLKRIKKPTVIIEAPEKQRYGLYKKFLERIGNPKNILLREVNIEEPQESPTS